MVNYSDGGAGVADYNYGKMSVFALDNHHIDAAADDDDDDDDDLFYGYGSTGDDDYTHAEKKKIRNVAPEITLNSIG